MYFVNLKENLPRHKVFPWGISSLLTGAALGLLVFGAFGTQPTASAAPPPPSYMCARDYDDDDYDDYDDYYDDYDDDDDDYDDDDYDDDDD